MIEDVARLRLTVDSTGITQARTKLNSLGNAGSSVTKKIAAGATASRIAFGALAVGVTAVGATVVKTTREWLKFNTAMKEVQTIAGASAKEMDSLRLKALGIAQALGVDATEAAEGFYQAISAGVPTAEVDKFVKVAAQLAQGGLADIGSATDLLTTALNSYGKSADNATQVSDQLFRTVKLGKTTIPLLARSLARASATANTAGVSLEELLGITAATTKQGVKTAESFTQVKAAIVALLNPSETMAAIYEKLGVEGGRALIEQEGLAGALEKVRLAAGGSDEVLVKALRSIEAYSLTASITGAKLEETKKAIEAIGEASGDTAEASKIAGETLGTSLKKLGNSFLIMAENANQATGANEGLSGSIADFADVLADPEIFRAYFIALNEFPAIIGRWIFLGQNAEQQVENFGKKLEDGAVDIAKYEKSLADSAEKRALRSGSLLKVAEKVLEVEKELAKQRKIASDYGGEENLQQLDDDIKRVSQSLKVMADNLNRGKITLSEYKKGLANLANLTASRNRVAAELETTKELEKQLGVYMRIGGAGGQIAEEQFKIIVKLARLNELLTSNKITTEQWRAEAAKLKQTFGEVEGRVQSFGKTFATVFGLIAESNQELIDIGQKALDIAGAEIKLAAMFGEETDKNIKILEDKLTVFDDFLATGKTLNADQQWLLNLYENQLKVLRDQNDEKGKSAAQSAREVIRENLATKQERASIEYTRTVTEIKKAKFEPEEEAQFIQRAGDQFAEDIKPDEERQGATNKAIDLQEGIDQEAERLEQYYESDLQRIARHEEDKRKIINEATNLTYQQRTDLIKKIEDDAIEQRLKAERDSLNQKLDATKDFFGGMSALAGAFGKKGFKTAQAFAIVEATISTYQSAAKAMATVPYPFNFIAAAGNIAYGLAQVAQIRSQQPPAYQQGGIVSGASYGGDQINARLNSGEMVLNKTQQSNLFAQANNPIAGGSRGGNVTIVNNAPVQLEGEVEQDDDGNFKIIVAQAVEQAKIELTNEAREGGGDFVPALETNYGLNRR